MDSLQRFLDLETTTAEISPSVLALQIEYPFIYITKVVSVELRYWLRKGILHQVSTTEDDVPLYLKSGDSFGLIGYITLCSNTFIVMNTLMERDIRFKANKDSDESIQESILDRLLLC